MGEVLIWWVLILYLVGFSLLGYVVRRLSLGGRR